MVSLRYVGTSIWERTLVKDDGKFDRSERVQSGAVVEGFTKEGAEKILSTPRYMRSFVAVNGPEDHYGDKFEANRLEAVYGSSNATAYPELDMGSTVTGRRTITRTEEDNEEGFAIAGPHEGPRSDNTEVLEAAEVQAEADKAAARKRAEQAKAHQSGSRQQGQPSSQKKSES